MKSEFPWWGNLNYTHGAMRATGVADGAHRTLLFEALVYARREGELQRSLYAYDPDRELARHVHHTVLVAESGFVEVIDEQNVRSRVTGVISRSEHAERSSHERILVPREGIADGFEVQLGTRSYRLPVELPSMKERDAAEFENWRLWLDHLLSSRQRPSPWWGTDGDLFAGSELSDSCRDDRQQRRNTSHEQTPAPAWLARGSHPTWDAFGAPCAAMRATGFTTDNGPALLIEAIVASRRLNEVRRETYAYGPGATAAPPDAALTPCHVLVPAAQIHGGEEGAGPRRVARGEALEVELDGRRHVVTMSLPTGDPRGARHAERALWP